MIRWKTLKRDFLCYYMSGLECARRRRPGSATEASCVYASIGKLSGRGYVASRSGAGVRAGRRGRLEAGRRRAQSAQTDIKQSPAEPRPATLTLCAQMRAELIPLPAPGEKPCFHIFLMNHVANIFSARQQCCCLGANFLVGKF